MFNFIVCFLNLVLGFLALGFLAFPNAFAPAGVSPALYLSYDFLAIFARFLSFGSVLFLSG